jgi:hypothetical protein
MVAIMHGLGPGHQNHFDIVSEGGPAAGFRRKRLKNRRVESHDAPFPQKETEGTKIENSIR